MVVLVRFGTRVDGDHNDLGENGRSECREHRNRIAADAIAREQAKPGSGRRDARVPPPIADASDCPDDNHDADG